jgi:FixJ family two-component response regulator
VICIVDDDVWARSGLEDLIGSLGYPARGFESAEEFVNSDILPQTICVITDLHMPGLNGLELQTLLRSRGHAIPIIFVTAYPSEAYRARAMAEGAVGFLAKPCPEGLLVDCLRRAIAA